MAPNLLFVLKSSYCHRVRALVGTKSALHAEECLCKGGQACYTIQGRVLTAVALPLVFVYRGPSGFEGEGRLFRDCPLIYTAFGSSLGPAPVK